LFCSDKELRKLSEKTDEKREAKRCASSKIMLTSGLGNKVFQLFTEIINLAGRVDLCWGTGKLKCVRVTYSALLKKKGHR
jgi:hypothetical protein